MLRPGHGDMRKYIAQQESGRAFPARMIAKWVFFVFFMPSNVGPRLMTATVAVFSFGERDGHCCLSFSILVAIESHLLTRGARFLQTDCARKGTWSAEQRSIYQASIRRMASTLAVCAFLVNLPR